MGSAEVVQGGSGVADLGTSFGEVTLPAMDANDTKNC